MEVDCEGCAGCCVDWRALFDDAADPERRGANPPVDDTYDLVPLTRDEVRAFLDAGLADALAPRLWRAAGDGGESDGEDDGPVTVDGVPLATVGGRPAFYVGLRKPPKPVGPFDTEDHWLPACVFLDPETLQCRIHGTDLYPDECATYPGYHLTLDQEPECRRVERAFGGERLLDGEPPSNATPMLGPGAIGGKVFVHPDPDRLAGRVERLAAGEPTTADRAEFVAVAAASAPGLGTVNEDAYERFRERALAADSWAGRAAEEWSEAAGDAGEPATASPDPTTVEEDRGAPPTPGWDAVTSGSSAGPGTPATNDDGDDT